MPSATPPKALCFVSADTVKITINKSHFHFYIRTKLISSRELQKIPLPDVPPLFSNTVLFGANHQDNKSHYTQTTIKEHSNQYELNISRGCQFILGLHTISQRQSDAIIPTLFTRVVYFH